MKKWRDLRMKGTQKLNWNVLTIIDVFLNQKRVNTCDHTVKEFFLLILMFIFPLTWTHFQKLSSDAIFVVCSQTFTLFWLIKTALPVKISRYSFRVPILQWSLHFLVRVFTFLSLILLIAIMLYFSDIPNRWPCISFTALLLKLVV